MKIFSLVGAILFCSLAAGKSFATDSNRKPDVIVATDGSGDVKTVKEAMTRVPENNRKRFVIFIKRGIYNEDINIAETKPYVTFRGEHAKETKLTFSVNSAAAATSWPWCSVHVGGQDFHAENITFENSFGVGAQAHAVAANADRLVFRNCRFLGRQDTLYAKAGRHFFQNCHIKGTKDFICGQAAAVFENCTVHSIADGYIAAPMRFSPTEPSGLIFVRCKLTATKIRDGVFLGRPWGPHGRAVYLETEMGGHIRPEGWNNWANSANEKTAYFAEYDCRGAGANPAGRVKWIHQLTAEKAREFEAENFLKGKDGWNPKKSDDEWLEKIPPQ